MKEELFYSNYYDDIKFVESNLIDTISQILKPLIQQSESKLIEYTTSRIKSSDSVINKLKKMNLNETVNDAIENLSDIVGIRLVVHFLGDIYTIRNILVNSGELNVIKEKDYIRKAKRSGYRGYHIVVEHNGIRNKIKAEIQIRTIAMDCWASLEHQLRYKKVIKNAELIDLELKKCSDDLMSADIAMEQILNLVHKSSEYENRSDCLYEDAMSCASKNKE